MKALFILLFLLATAAGIQCQLFPGLEPLDNAFLYESPRDPDLGLRGGYNVTANGILRVPVIFVDREEDTVPSAHWPLGGDPLYIQDFIDSQPYVAGQVWPRLNLSKYMHTMSNGMFNLIGDTYRYTIPAGMSFSSMYTLTTHVLTVMDSNIDYSDYDNWQGIANYNFQPTPDGEVDWVFVIYRFPLVESQMLV